MDAVLYIAAALSAVCAVLLVIVITKLNRPSAQDGQIAAHAAHLGAPLATRNTADFTDLGIALINPWRG